LSNRKALETEPLINEADAKDPCNPAELKENYLELAIPISGHDLPGNIYALWS
jgi:hypothetical protein